MTEIRKERKGGTPSLQRADVAILSKGGEKKALILTRDKSRRALHSILRRGEGRHSHHTRRGRDELEEVGREGKKTTLTRGSS